MKNCPYCGAEIKDQPQPSLHAASTIYDCGLHIIEFIGVEGFYIEVECQSKTQNGE